MESNFVDIYGNEYRLVIQDGTDFEIELGDNPVVIEFEPVGGINPHFPAFIMKKLVYRFLAPNPIFFEDIARGRDQVILFRNGVIVFTGSNTPYKSGLNTTPNGVYVEFTALSYTNILGKQPYTISAVTKGGLHQITTNDGEDTVFENEYFDMTKIEYRPFWIENQGVSFNEFWEMLNATFLVSFYPKSNVGGLKAWVHNYAAVATPTRELQPVNEFATRNFWQRAKNIILEYNPTVEPFPYINEGIDLDGNYNDASPLSVNSSITNNVPGDRDLTARFNFGRLRFEDTLNGTAITGGFYHDDSITILWELEAQYGATVRYWNNGSANWQSGSIYNTIFENESDLFTKNSSFEIPGPATALDNVNYTFRFYTGPIVSSTSKWLNNDLIDTSSTVVGTRDIFMDGMTVRLDYKPGDFNDLTTGLINSIRTNQLWGGSEKFQKQFSFDKNRVPATKAIGPVYKQYTNKVNAGDDFARDYKIAITLDNYSEYIDFNPDVIYNLDTNPLQIYERLSDKMIDFLVNQYETETQIIRGQFVADETSFMNPFALFLYDYGSASKIAVNMIKGKIDCFLGIVGGQFIERKL